MYMCVWVGVWVGGCKYMYVCVLLMRISMPQSLKFFTHIYIYICVYVYVWVCVRVCVCVCVCVNICMCVYC